MPVARRGRTRSEQDSANATSSDVCEAPLYRFDINTSKNISFLSNSPSESVVLALQRMTPAIIQTRSGENVKKHSQSSKDKSLIRRSKIIK